MKEPLAIKSTFINERWHVRLFCEDKLKDEMVCQVKADVRLVVRDMLRWYDKMGNTPYSPMADASRARNKNYERPQGKVWQKSIDTGELHSVKMGI
jgi:hypothetical protein